MKNIQRLLIALLSAGLLVSISAACGSDDTSGTGSDENAENAENGDEEEVEFTAEHVLVDVSPTRLTYAVGTQITPSATVYDKRWEEASEYDIEWSVTPEEAVEKSGDSWIVREAGTITFEACVLNQIDQLTGVCGERDVVSAIGTDRIVIESPAPGEYFDGAEHDTIPVTGTVDPAMNVDSVQVNGTTVSVDEESRFTHELSPQFGVNTVVVRASDGVNQDDVVAAVGAMWAPTYLETEADSAAGQIGATIEKAILLNLGQNFFDDDEPYTEISESQIVTHDLADILQLVLDYVDISSQFSNPVVDTSALQLSVLDVAINDPVIDLDVTNDGIELFGQIPNLTAETEGFIDLSDEVLDLTGDISASVSLFASIDVEKTSRGEPFNIEMSDFELAVESATANFESEEANAIFELADSVLRENLEDIILEGLDLSFIETLPDLLLDLFTSLDEVLAGQEFEIDLDLGEPITLSFDGGIEELVPFYGQGLDGFLSASLAIDSQPHHPNNPGIPHLSAETDASPLFTDSRVQLGLNLAFINGILHNVWNAGLLDLDITELIPDDLSGLIDEGSTSGLLPPVAGPPVKDSPHDLLLHLGQLELDITWQDQTDRFMTEIIVGADLNVIGDEIAIEIADEPHIEMWLIESSEAEPLMPADDLRDMVTNALWPEIENAIGEGLGFALPIPELTALEPYAPALADMTLDVRMMRALDIRQGFLMIDAAIEGTLFLP